MDRAVGLPLHDRALRRTRPPSDGSQPLGSEHGLTWREAAELSRHDPEFGEETRRRIEYLRKEAARHAARTVY